MVIIISVFYGDWHVIMWIQYVVLLIKDRVEDDEKVGRKMKRGICKDIDIAEND